MPPTLRSAPTTPNQRTTRNSNKVALADATPEPSPRSCTKCKRPRKGHPRSGCPFSDGDGGGPGSPGVMKRLEALDLSADDLDSGEDTEPEAGEGEATPTEKGKKEKTKTPRVSMPGTLGPLPTWILSQSQASVSVKAEDIPRIESLSLASIPLSEPAPAEAARIEFTTSLADLARAVVYVLPTSSAASAAAEALTFGLFVRQLPLDHTDTFLLVGKTDASVAVLEKQVETKMHALVPKDAQAGPGAAKGIVLGAVGAVAAWGALAFA
ncbi:hypothetical protein MKEN_01302100 [Mycena kentingensis (nom. inval.)]|nr:hypothetical protein MKEN_01302100 [Mycena kentingensis (nom. inval.)]